jgi:DNA-binding NtrC family response regulator
MKQGAYEFVTKPIDFDRLDVLIDRAIESLELRSEVSYLRRTAYQPYSDIIGKDSGLREAMELARQVAPSDTTVLIRGETGTGKEVMARAVHRLSNRSDRTFVVANCAAIPRDLMESEMFGHMKGAFTGAIANHAGYFEAAGQGTLFLDEIGDLDLDLQSKILRVLEDGSFKRVGSNTNLYNRARIIASTHQPLEKLIEEGKFREDLFYRINVFPIKLSPLRERKEDILKLAYYFINLYTRRLGREEIELDQSAEEELLNHPWPGNVRELKNCLERLVLTSAEKVITSADLTHLLNGSLSRSKGSTVLPLKEMEKRAIQSALRKFGGNRTRTAEALGIGRRTLQNKLKLYENSEKD